MLNAFDRALPDCLQVISAIYQAMTMHNWKLAVKCQHISSSFKSRSGCCCCCGAHLKATSSQTDTIRRSPLSNCPGTWLPFAGCYLLAVDCLAISCIVFAALSVACLPWCAFSQFFHCHCQLRVWMCPGKPFVLCFAKGYFIIST